MSAVAASVSERVDGLLGWLQVPGGGVAELLAEMVGLGRDSADAATLRRDEIVASRLLGHAGADGTNREERDTGKRDVVGDGGAGIGAPAALGVAVDLHPAPASDAGDSGTPDRIGAWALIPHGESRPVLLVERGGGDVPPRLAWLDIARAES